ncbi:hypothetical protein [Cryptosporangium japonicum]|uniref:Uncharacterized protein n=1 Tax=Cryptosporangium japonicum TaxID=80872 RepID=A0ABN0V783_9ACTN
MTTSPDFPNQSVGEGSGLPRPGDPSAGRTAEDAHRETQVAPGTLGAAGAVAAGDLGVDAIPELNPDAGDSGYSAPPVEDAGADPAAK